MSGAETVLSATAVELRRAFDRSFAEAPSIEPPAFDDFLAIRVASNPYVIRLTEVAGLFADRIVTRLPTALPAFRGVAGFRGTILPVYDLRVFLGYTAEEVPRWLMVAKSAPIAIVFDHFEGHLRTPRMRPVAEPKAEHSRQHVQEILNVAGLMRPVVQLESVCEEIRKSAPPRAPA